MNRSILIVICDFLLVSLLAFSTVDINKVSNMTSPRGISVTMATNQPSSGQDLANVMKLALNDEHRNRTQLQGELAKTKLAAEQGQALLVQREQQTQALQQQLTQKEQQYAQAQSSIANLNQQLQTSTTQSAVSEEKLTEMQANLKKQAAQAAALQAQLAELGRSNQLAYSQNQQLSSQLQLAEVEKQNATEMANVMREQVQVERAEKAKLADDVKVLATNSVQLAQEIRDNRPLAPNTIFGDFVSNRVDTEFTATKPGLFGTDVKSKIAETILVTDGTNTMALCHVQDTPLTLWSPGTDWTGLSGSFIHGSAHVPIESLSFDSLDPRIVMMPVTPGQAQQLGARVYRTSGDPYKFQDAVLVGAREGYYGQCSFQIDLSTPNYVKLDRSLLKGLFGTFNPSRGDLVFSRTGELLGVMANSTYCMVLRGFNPSATLHFTSNVKDQHTGDTLSKLFAYVYQMPLKLQ